MWHELWYLLVAGISGSAAIIIAAYAIIQADSSRKQAASAETTANSTKAISL